VGRLLVEEAVAWAEANGADAIYGPPQWWRPEGDDLRPALIRIFRSSGFEEVGEGARMLVLRKELPGS
jgi:hypothetical protein